MGGQYYDGSYRDRMGWYGVDRSGSMKLVYLVIDLYILKIYYFWTSTHLYKLRITIDIQFLRRSFKNPKAVEHRLSRRIWEVNDWYTCRIHSGSPEPSVQGLINGAFHNLNTNLIQNSNKRYHDFESRPLTFISAFLLQLRPILINTGRCGTSLVFLISGETITYWLQIIKCESARVCPYVHVVSVVRVGLNDSLLNVQKWDQLKQYLDR
jgi:hypothetical protein